MCDPVTALVALTATTTVVSTVEQMKAASRQRAAIAAADAEREEQIDDQHAAEATALAREARRQRARIRVAAGESGLSLTAGSAEDALLTTLLQEDTGIADIGANQAAAQRGRATETQSALASVQSPSLFGAGLQIATSAITINQRYGKPKT